MEKRFHRLKEKLLLLAVAITLCGGLSFGAQGRAAADIMGRVAQETTPLRASAITGERPAGTPVFHDNDGRLFQRIQSEKQRRASGKETFRTSLTTLFAYAPRTNGAHFFFLTLCVLLVHSGSRTVIMNYIHDQDGLK